MQWTRDMKYRKIEDITEKEYKLLLEKTMQANWRQKYHIQPVTGLLNDPNGFVYHDGTYHLFYQWFPLGAVHGMKYWYYVTSKDLVHFDNHGPRLHPDTKYDSHGAYSGSGIVVNDEVKLVYTGNHRTKDWDRVPYQMVATLNDDAVTKETPFIMGPPHGYTEHFRDPKVWDDGDSYYIVIGAQRSNETGTIVVYESKDFKTWTFKGEIQTDYTHFGYMWECPDYFNLSGYDFLIFCAQGVASHEDKYRNIHQSGYLMGTFDLDTLTMTHRTYEMLDYGFDFYAPQTTHGAHGRVLIGWMGLPDTNYPTDVLEWAHCLTVPRVLTVEHGRLIQRPIDDIKKRRKNSFSFNEIVSKKAYVATGEFYDLEVDIKHNTSENFHIDLRVSDTQYTRLTYNRLNRRFTFDRTFSGELPEPVDGTTRSVNLDEELTQLRIFVDVSSVEIFLNDGTHVCTSRIFPNDDATGIYVSSEHGTVNVNMTKYDLEEGA